MDSEERELSRYLQSYPWDEEAKARYRALRIRRGANPNMPRGDEAHSQARDRHERRKWRKALPERFRDMLDDRGLLPAFAWPGGYDIVYVGDGEELCADCANLPEAREWWGSHPGMFLAQETDSRVECSHCYRVLQGTWCEQCREHTGDEHTPPCDHACSRHGIANCDDFRCEEDRTMQEYSDFVDKHSCSECGGTSGDHGFCAWCNPAPEEDSDE